ncbi:hypothetical protein Dimus_019072 [Dionaea muscipula]
MRLTLNPFLSSPQLIIGHEVPARMRELLSHTALEPPDRPAPPSRSDETRSLVQPDVWGTVRSRRRKRRTARSSVGDWRPSLFAISEEGVEVPESVERKRKVESGRERKRCALGSSPTRHARGGCDLFGFVNDSNPMVIPAFAPTPFMF